MKKAIILIIFVIFGRIGFASTNGDTLQTLITRVSTASWKFKGEYSSDTLVYGRDSLESRKLVFYFQPDSGAYTGNLYNKVLQEDMTYMNLGAPTPFELGSDTSQTQVYFKLYTGGLTLAPITLQVLELSETRMVLYNRENHHQFIYTR